MDFSQEVVFLTGANRGIGRALLNEIIHRGVKRIYAAVRNPESLGELADNVVGIKLDITDRSAVKAAAAQAGDATLLINNAGVLAVGSLLDSPLELIARDLDTNYYGTLNMIRAFAPVIEANGGGAIVNILTMVSLASIPGIGGYCASKAAAHSLTQAVRAELKSRSISVHGVFPGAIETEMTAAMQMPKTSAEAVAAAIVEGIENEAEDIYPDPMSARLSQIWLQNPKKLEQALAAM